MTTPFYTLIRKPRLLCLLWCLLACAQLPARSSPAAAPAFALFGESLMDSRGNTVWARSLAECRYLLLYRASADQPESRAFTLELIRFWERNHAGNQFDVVLLPAETTREKALDHLRLNRLPWYAVDPASPFYSSLASRFAGQETPALLLFARSGEMLSSSYLPSGEYAGTGRVLTVLSEKLIAEQITPEERRAEKMRTDNLARSLILQRLRAEPDHVEAATVIGLFPFSGTLRTTDGYAALLGNKVVKVGEVLEGVARVEAITKDRVQLRIGSRLLDIAPKK